MKIKWLVGIIIILAIGAFILLSGEKKSNPADEQAAIAATEEWLKLVDTEEYSDSYHKGAERLKKLAMQETWEEYLVKKREPLGKVKSREITGITYHTSILGSWNKEYYVITYKTEFENKEKAIESVNPLREDDGVWRISAYNIDFYNGR